MAKQTKDTLKPDDIEQSLQECFIEYLKKCREIVYTKFKNEHDIDSEVSLTTHHMLHEFDKYRTRVD